MNNPATSRGATATTGMTHIAIQGEDSRLAIIAVKNMAIPDMAEYHCLGGTPILSF
ncbi:MAG: hypothetical protein WAJ93_25300 [Candidatus Nitrosopolaris sp.]